MPKDSNLSWVTIAPGSFGNKAIPGVCDITFSDLGQKSGIHQVESFGFELKLLNQ